MTQDEILLTIFISVISLYFVLRYLDVDLVNFLPSLNRQEITSVISSYTLLEADGLTSLHKGKINNYEYNLLTNNTGRVIALITLHKNTSQHIVAIGNKSGLASLLLKPRLKKILEQIDLEGNFPNYFKMYCKPGTGQNLIQLFDPKDMAYFADFCQAYDFELYQDSIYITQAPGAIDKTDTTSLIKDAEIFLTSNNKLLEKLGVF